MFKELKKDKTSKVEATFTKFWKDEKILEKSIENCEKCKLCKR